MQQAERFFLRLCDPLQDAAPHELPPRISRWQFRRRGQARGAGPPPRPSRAKPAAYRAIDTHAGAGLYDLAGPEAARSGEWHARHRAAPRRPHRRAIWRALLAPYLDAVAACNPPGRLTTYPGSPALVRAFLRAQDRLVACELEPNAAAALARNFAGDRRIKTIAIDGWTALNAYVPPPGTPRPRADRSAVRGRRRISPPRARPRSRPPQMGERHLPAVVPDQDARAAGRAGAPPAALRHRQDPARRARRRPAARAAAASQAAA